MWKRLVVLLAGVLALSANAQNLVIDDFEGYADDGQLQAEWSYSVACGGSDLQYMLDTNSPPQGTRCMFLDVYMAERWCYNTVRRDIPGGPVNLDDYLSVSFQMGGDSTVKPGLIEFVVFLFDGQGRAMRYKLPDSYLTTESWQKVSLSLGSFTQEEWDAGYGTAAPDADPTDIISIGFMVVGQEIDQYAFISIDDVQLKVKSENLLVDDFEGYANDADLAAAWPYTPSGQDSTLTWSIDKTNTPPQGASSLLLDINMPYRWWYNKVQTRLSSALDLTKYSALEMWFYGDADMTPSPGQVIFVVELFDSTGRAVKYTIPNETAASSSWRKLTLSLASFVQEEWDSGYGTSNPDANPKDITDLALMMVGDASDTDFGPFTGQFYVDGIQFVSAAESAAISGSIAADGAPLEGVKVMAIDQSGLVQTRTDAAGAYSFDDLKRGGSYRIVPLMAGYEFDPAAVTVSLLDPAMTQDFTAAAAAYPSLDSVSIADQFDASGLSPNVAYRGAREWGEEEAGDVRPVIDVTQDKTYVVNFPGAQEYDAVMPGVPANTLSGALSPKYAVEIGSYYGWDMLAFGQDTDMNYYVEADVWCDWRFDLPENMFDRVSVGMHCSVYDPDRPSLDGYGPGNENYSSGGYALSFESDSGDVIARKYAKDNGRLNAVGRTEGFAVDFARMTLTDSGWHRFRVEYTDGTVTFVVDGETLAEVQDVDYTFGPAGLHYRACFSDAPADLQNMNHARFDNLKAGPTGAGIKDWMLN
ncbi:MAG: hypothetical protein GC154_20485 [bacterium]|nr:hypothetical protein [bacterium]